MLYDLNVPWSPTQSSSDLQRTITFLSTLSYTVLALNHTLPLPLPPQITNPIPLTPSFPLSPKIVLLRRCTLPISDPAQNHRLSILASTYDILALRPTTEKAFLSACTSLSEHSIISLDFTQRLPFPFRPKPFMTAINRGIRFEICYAQATMDAGGSAARRNFISNCMGIVRATRGRGLVVSSEARSALGVRPPADVVNLLAVWGLGRERGLEALGVNPRSVVVNEGMKRNSFRGVIEIVDGGEARVGKDQAATNADVRVLKGNKTGNSKNENGKRKAGSSGAGGEGTPQISKRQQKRMRLEARKAEEQSPSPATTGGRPVEGPADADGDVTSNKNNETNG